MWTLVFCGRKLNKQVVVTMGQEQHFGGRWMSGLDACHLSFLPAVTGAGVLVLSGFIWSLNGLNI